MINDWKTYAIAFPATGLVFLGIDAVWLSVVAPRLYRPLLGGMLLDRFNLLPALLFYLIYIFGIVFFAVAPALTVNHWALAATYGALLGLVAYSTYDLTNQATLQNWPIVVTIADLCWGTFLTAISATAGYLIVRAFMD
jgi:uncharacterized membrane protein